MNDEHARSAPLLLTDHSDEGEDSMNAWLRETSGDSSATVKRDEQGRPWLVTATGIQFISRSHTSQRLVVAYGGEHPVGVDIESFNRRMNPDLLIRAMNDDERAAMKAVPLDQQPRMCVLTWSLKEAVAKFWGWPIARARHHVSVFPALHDGVDMRVVYHHAPLKHPTQHLQREIDGGSSPMVVSVVALRP